MKQTRILVILGLLFCSAFIVEASPFSHLAQRLRRYQTQGGGFRSQEGGSPNVEATSYALQLASFFGNLAHINHESVETFVKSIENADFGFGHSHNTPSDISSVSHAVQILKSINSSSLNPVNVATHVKSLLHDTGLFAAKAGEKATLKATALAFETLDTIGQLDSDWVKASVPKVKAFLEKNNFANDADLSEVAKHYYASTLGRHVGYEPKDAEKSATSITALQSPSGLWYSDAAKKTTSLEATRHALGALHALGRGNKNFLEKINLTNLKNALKTIPADLTSAIHTYLSLASTDSFSENFNTKSVIEGQETGPIAENIVEGTHIRPILVLNSIFDGHALASLEVSAKTKFYKQDAVVSKLSWNAEFQRYEAPEYLATDNKLGPVEFVYTVKTSIPGLGPITFDVKDSRSVGYGVAVRSKATIQLSDREAREGETVPINTLFKFEVALSSRGNNNIVSGSHEVTFSVLDSSNDVIHTEKSDRSSGKGLIAFTYELTNPATLPGRLSFKFDVTGTGAEHAHSSRTVVYYLANQLIASSIFFEGRDGKNPTVKLGETVKVTFIPATLPDMKTVNPLAVSQAVRHFVMDVKSAGGLLLAEVPSVATGNTITFNLPVTATTDFIGTNLISFRYKSASGEEVVLANYDSAQSELYDDSSALSITVKADLQLTDVTESAKPGEHLYGNQVAFRFAVKDSVSGKFLSQGKTAGITLSLAHQEEGLRSYTSVNVPAVSSEAKGKPVFAAVWVINPNAIRGPGSLSINAVDADGKALPLVGADKKPLTVKVSIGGNIAIHPHTYTASLDSQHSVFLTEFNVTCNEQVLKDAHLRASIVYGSKQAVVATLPVAHNDGLYSVSWTASNKHISSGEYKIHLYREVDRTRALERLDAKQKKERKERALKGEEDIDIDRAVDEENLNLDPLFTVDLSHRIQQNTSLPVRTQFIGLVLFGGIFVWAQSQKRKAFSEKKKI